MCTVYTSVKLKCVSCGVLCGHWVGATVWELSGGEQLDLVFPLEMVWKGDVVME